MSTQSINPYSNNNNSGNNNAKKVGIAAAAVGAAGIGTAAAMAAKDHFDDEPIVDQAEEVVPEEETPVSEPKNDHKGQDGSHQPRQPQTPPRDHDKPEEKPGDKPGEQQGEKPGDEKQGDKPGEETPGDEKHGDNPGDKKQGDNPGDEKQGDNPGEQQHDQDDELTAQQIKEYDDDNLDPDKEVDQLLAEEHIDHEGDDQALAPDVIQDYQEVGMIYGENDEAVAAAYAYDADGNPIMLVDVDGDQMYDLGITEDYNMDVSDLAINVGDAELDAAGNDEYLANNGENVDNFEGEDFSNDIVC